MFCDIQEDAYGLGQRKHGDVRLHAAYERYGLDGCGEQGTSAQ